MRNVNLLVEEWERAEHGGAQELRESPIPYVLQAEAETPQA